VWVGGGRKVETAGRGGVAAPWTGSKTPSTPLYYYYYWNFIGT